MKTRTVTQDLILRLRAHALTLGMNATDYAAGKLMEVSQPRISNWSRGKANMNDEAIARACGIMWPGDSAMAAYWLARRQAEAAQTAELRRPWEYLLETLSQNKEVARALAKKAAAVALVAGAAGLAPPPQAAEFGTLFVAGGSANKYYVKSRGRRKPRRAGRRGLSSRSQNATGVTPVTR